MLAGLAALPERPRLVELLGPAGVGKSTLARALPSADASIGIGPAIWGLSPRHLLAAAFAVVPIVVGALLEGRPLRPMELRQMIRLGALRRAVEREAGRGDRVLILDEGPLFALAWLEVRCAPDGSPSRARWRRRELDGWAGRLDSVVRLDAHDRVLADRIRGRARAHRVKDLPDAEIDRFGEEYRAAFDRVLAELRAAGPVPVLRLRTDESSPEQAANRLRWMISGGPDGR